MRWNGRLPEGRRWPCRSSRARLLAGGGLLLLAGATVALGAGILLGAFDGMSPTQPVVGGVLGSPGSGRRPDPDDDEGLVPGLLGQD